VETLWQDIRYALRLMARSPGFVAAGVLTLALGIGANTAIFSLVYGVLLRPLPYPNDSRLAMVYMHFSPQNNPRGTMSIADYLDWRAYNHAFEEPSLFTSRTMNLTNTDDPEQLMGAMVTAGFFPALQVAPLAGRFFAAGEDAPASPHLVVIAESFWRRRFAANRNALGRPISINGVQHTIIGVMPGAFRFPRPETELWTNLQLVPPTRRGPFFYRGFARLKPGFTVAQAQAETNAIGRRIESANSSYSHLSLPVIPLREAMTGRARLALLVMFGSVVFVLLISTVNIANLLLSRAAAREREVAVRLSLGAAYSRLIRQMLTESTLLALMGGAAGIGLAALGIRLLRASRPADLPRMEDIHLDGHVLAFTLVVSLVAGLFFGMVPAMQSVRTDLTASLKQGGRGGASGGARRRTHSFLVVAEVALSLVLLIGAGLFLRSFARLQKVNPGFAAPPEHVLTVRVTPNLANYTDNRKGIAFYAAVLERVRALPGVEAAAITDSLPPDDIADEDTFFVQGQELAAGESNPAIGRVAVSADYFRSLGIPVLQGRSFDQRDAADSAPVAMISESLALTYFPNRNPLGMWIAESSGLPHLQIVGIVGDTKYWGLDAEKGVAYYTPYTQRFVPNMFLAVRSGVPPSSLLPAIRGEIRAVDRDVVANQEMTLAAAMADSIAQPRFRTGLLGLFAGVALLLAAIGVYGVIAYSVSQRTGEIGIRIALGAQPVGVLSMILREGMRLAVLGVAIGAVCALLLGQYVSSLLFGVTPHDPLTFASVTAVLVSAAALACWVPARRAMRVDPMVALRNE
jgi:putative ABC transport system permease protein